MPKMTTMKSLLKLITLKGHLLIRYCQVLNLTLKMRCLSCKKRICTSRRLKKVLVSFTSLGCINSSVVY
uniref:Similar to EBS1 (EMS-MUTAGENIZED BRI1 SUPPRESSOR 1) n=1 Tax=Arundo donax TaxID=35708 RepID=A0A0A9FWE9_ARUDO